MVYPNHALLVRRGMVYVMMLNHSGGVLVVFIMVFSRSCGLFVVLVMMGSWFCGVLMVFVVSSVRITMILVLGESGNRDCDA